MKTKKKGYGYLLALTIFFVLLVVSTLVPSSSASKACMLGYRAHCTFTPVSTVILLLCAGAVCVVRAKKFTEKE